MMKKLKLLFVDHDSGFVPEKSLVYRVLARHFEIDQTSSPEVVISCGLGVAHTKYDRCVKIVWIGENVVPDFNWFDYAVGFDHLEFGDRYLRVPLYAFYGSYRQLAERGGKTDEQLLKRRFCSFVASNPQRDPIVFEFVRRLSEYKQVDCGGRLMNNVGGWVKDKLAFCANYKFNVAFENSSSSGYTTEKLMEPLAVESVPIYWGNPLVERDFCPDCMVRVAGAVDIDRAVKEIIRLDQDDAAYLKRVRSPCLAGTDLDAYERRLEGFLVRICERVLADGVAAARRRNFYGAQVSQRKYLGPILRGYERARAVAWFGLNLLRGRMVGK